MFGKQEPAPQAILGHAIGWGSEHGDTHIVVSGRPAGVELHVELPFFASQFIVLGLFLSGQRVPLQGQRAVKHGPAVPSQQSHSPTMPTSPQGTSGPHCSWVKSTQI